MKGLHCSIRCWRIGSISLGTVLLSVSLAQANLYSLTDVTGTVSLGSTAFNLNNSGQVVGDRGYGAPSFLYSNGTLTNLTPGGSSAPSINDSGQVAVNQGGRALVYTNGVMTDLGDLGGGGGAARGINNSGQVVGQSIAADGNSYAFLYSNDTMTNLGTLGPNGVQSLANSINDSGQVVGMSIFSNGDAQAFLYSNGTMTGLSGGAYVARDINNAGQVVGDLRVGQAFQAFLYSDDTMTNLGTLGGTSSEAYGINTFGHVVGTALTAGGMQHAFLFRNGSIIDLNNLLDPSGDGWTLLQANAINDTGQIVGFGLHGTTQAAFLLTPVPLPGAAWLFGSGVLVLLRRTVHRRWRSQK